MPVLEIHASRADASALFDVLSSGESEIEHWALFRSLVAATGVDVEEAESEARKQIASVQTKNRTSNQPTFWQRESGGKATNRHALRKRDKALKTWEAHETNAAGQWRNGLRFGDTGAAVDGESLENVNARQLQGTVLLDPDATIQEQLCAALHEHMARMIGACPHAHASRSTARPALTFPL